MLEPILDEAMRATLAGHPDHLILLRPDHYVAACFRASDIAHGSDLMGALLQKTWRSAVEGECVR